MEYIKITIQIAVFLLLAMSDVEDAINKKIPIIYPLAIGIISSCYTITGLLQGRQEISEAALSLIPGVLMILMTFVTGKSIGIGDGLMVLTLGPALGIEMTLLSVLAAFVITSVVSGVLLIFKRVTMKSSLHPSMRKQGSRWNCFLMLTRMPA